ncbi:TadE/TadG family type IV pilus assembly protein [Streptomyces atratus]|uniref:TadE/TadG family type IV pilus assembly protein n=1 Tax=Streptomyces atratus TaxID=1893 RepID=UPI0021A3C92E|nr:TadE/TadG family type IV pilus assembly protein [Streptomyces atratus]MCT2543924.1 pilus assembly protein [Streptomyces atratus]
MTATETKDTEIWGRRYGDAAPARGGTRVHLVGRGRDRGQTAIEFLGVTPLIILLCVALWQCALIGYTFSLAANAADEAAHAGAISEGSRGHACRDASEKNLPKVWREGMKRTNCDDSSGLYKATVKLRVPVLVPGVFNLPMTIEGNAASPLEAER